MSASASWRKRSYVDIKKRGRSVTCFSYVEAYRSHHIYLIDVCHLIYIDVFHCFNEIIQHIAILCTLWLNQPYGLFETMLGARLKLGLY